MTDLEHRLVALFEHQAAAADVDIDEEFLAERRSAMVTDERSRGRRLRPMLFAAASLIAVVGVVGVLLAVPERSTNTSVVVDTVEDALPSTTLPDTTAPATTAPATTAPPTTMPPATMPLRSDQALVVTDYADVTEAVVPLVGTDPFTEWIVPWDGGFLAAANSTSDLELPDERIPELVESVPPEWRESLTGSPNPSADELVAALRESGLWNSAVRILLGELDDPDGRAAAYFSANGETWQSIELELPQGVTEIREIAAAGDRLVALASVGDGYAVLTTTDLEEWTIEEVTLPPDPRDVPAAVQIVDFPGGLVANDDGWAVGVRREWQLDVDAVAAHVGIDQFTGGWTGADGGIEVTIDLDTDAERAQFVSYEELGLTEDDVTELLRFRSPRFVSARWSGEPTILPPVDADRIVAVDGGIVAIGQTLVQLDGDEWVELFTPPSGVLLYGAFAIGPDLGVLVGSPVEPRELLRIATDTGRSEPLAIQGVPAGVEPVGAGGRTVTYSSHRASPADGRTWFGTIVDGRWVMAELDPPVSEFSHSAGPAYSGDRMLISHNGAWHLYRFES